MDIEIDLRRGDFEAMHPKAKLFSFDEDKKLYTGDGVESINDQWTTWCACIGMLCLDGKEAQAVPEGFVLVPKKATKKMLDAGYEAHDGFFSNGAVQDVYVAMIEAQEPAND